MENGTPNAIELSESEITIERKKTKQLTAKVFPVDGKSVTWSSSNEDIASVDETGLVTAVAEGNAVITVTTTDGGFTDTCTVTVISNAPGTSQTMTVGTASFNMVISATGTFPTGTSDSGTATISTPYQIAETETTNALVREVYQWAYDNSKMTGGTVSSSTVSVYGQELLDLDDSASQISFSGGTFSVDSGKEQFPVIDISWYGSILFCNWLTEMLDGNTNNVVYSGMDSNWNDDETIADTNKTGFRLPSHEEWEAAARYIGTSNPGYGIEKPASSGIYWTPGDYASGATADYNNSSATSTVAWYVYNAGSYTKAVKTKAANQLGLYDMSGNVWEWVFDGYGSDRVLLGGSWGCNANYLRVGNWYYYYAYDTDDYLGFRPTRTL